MITLGFIEVNSIAIGVHLADEILKTAETELIMARPTCPGKYCVLFSGDVAAVEASMQHSKNIAGQYLIDDTVIARVHEQIPAAISDVNFVEEFAAIGVMEYFSITGAIYGGDAAVKAADVDIVNIRLASGIGGKSFVVITGEVAAVREAVECGCKEAKEAGLLIHSIVIPNPRKEIIDSLL